LLQPVQICRYFFGWEFSNQGKCRKSKSAERCFHHFTNFRLTSLGSRGKMDFPVGANATSLVISDHCCPVKN